MNSMTYTRSPIAAATDRRRAAGNASSCRTGTAEDRIACLEVLAAQLHARGWTAYLSTPAGRLARLFVQDPDDQAECGDVMAALDDLSGEWWYWFGWAERIAPVSTSALAADAVIQGLQRPADRA
jgi:hypothetical protein